MHADLVLDSGGKYGVFCSFSLMFCPASMVELHDEQNGSGSLVAL
jgi:hypothetical protein